MYVYDSINTVYVRLCTLMTTVMSFTLLDSHKPNSDPNTTSFQLIMVVEFEYDKKLKIYYIVTHVSFNSTDPVML